MKTRRRGIGVIPAARLSRTRVVAASPACDTRWSGASPASKLHEVIARLASAGSGIVMIAPGYSRNELIANLREIEAALRGRRQGEAPGAGEEAEP